RDHALAPEEEEPPFVWSAKLKSPNRQQPLPHGAEVLALQAQIDEGIETHLYLTDYRSLNVGLVDEITDEDVLSDTPGEAEHMPAYYHGRPADFWFRLLDLRRLVADDTVATITELQKLRNVRYHDRPVSLYGGMVELPLLVTREDNARWFADAAPLTEGRLWAQLDAEQRGETERLSRELRDNLLGHLVWAVLEPATHTFLANAEAVFRSRREDPRFDFSGPAISYAKAVETELNALLFPTLRRVLRGARPSEREVSVEGRRLDLGGQVPHQSIGTLRNLLQHNEVVQRAVRAALQHDHAWLLGQLPYQLTRLADLRNPAAHSGSVGREAAVALRDEVVGVGGEGVVVRIARARMRA
ncbi:MAG: hypothetical protein H0W11_12390, partial [Gemmatimonadetes bacterium]|nr:hypothetical protein [Gemmatimonadota bacterium]